jgi:hypothetical protein
MSSFYFGVVSVTIHNTRSKHEDTNFVALGVKIGGGAVQTTAKPMGNVNSGTFQVDLAFPGLDANPGDNIIFNYLIVNAGSAKQGAVEAALQNASTLWANGQGPASVNLTGALSDAQPWFNNELKTVLNPNSCDGMVAAEQDHWTYAQLTSLQTNSIFAHQTYQPGVHSGSGCGPNSQYTVGFEIDLNGPLF